MPRQQLTTAPVLHDITVKEWHTLIMLPPAQPGGDAIRMVLQMRAVTEEQILKRILNELPSGTVLVHVTLRGKGIPKLPGGALYDLPLPGGRTMKAFCA